MRTSYYLLTAAVLAAAGVVVYDQLPAKSAQGGPPIPMADPPPVGPVVPAAAPASPVDPSSPRPPLSGPGAAPQLPAVPPPPPAAPALPAVPTLPAVPALPAVAPPPALPTVPPRSPAPVTPKVPAPPLTVVPPPTPSPTPVVPRVPPPTLTPAVPSPSPTPPSLPPTLPPSGPAAKGTPLPAPTPLVTPPASVVGRFVILKGEKLIEGAVTMDGDKVNVRQGALNRPFPKADVLFVGTTHDDVRRFMVGKVHPADAPARLKVAKWCMYNGLREQAVAEAREVLKLQPANTGAADMVRALEESLAKFPTAGVVPAGGTAPPTPEVPKAQTPAPAPQPLPARPAPPPIPPAVDAEPNIPGEVSKTFTTRVQPILSNLCADCHARPHHAGAFKLVRTVGDSAGPKVTRQNLRAVAAQLHKDDPASSPLLVKALKAHGGMQRPLIVSRQAAAFKNLEGWVFLAAASLAPAAAKLEAKPEESPLPPVARTVPPEPKATLPPVAPPANTSVKFGQDVKPMPPSGPSPTSTGEPVDEFDPSVFNRAVHPPR